MSESKRTNRPSFQFYPADWLTDHNLKNCSFSAQGLWINLLCFMHRGVPYGHLADSQGKAISMEQVWKQTGAKHRRNFNQSLAELERNSVISRAEDGTYFSRRLVRDEQKRLKQAEFGKQGGNPTLKAPRKSRPPSSSSSSTASARPPLPPTGEDAHGFDLFWAAYPKKADKKAARRAWDKLKPSVELFNTMMVALEKQKQSEQWTKDGGGFVSNPATWLNGERWEDELPIAIATQKEEYDWRTTKLPTAKH